MWRRHLLEVGGGAGWQAGRLRWRAGGLATPCGRADGGTGGSCMCGGLPCKTGAQCAAWGSASRVFDRHSVAEERTRQTFCVSANPVPRYGGGARAPHAAGPDCARRRRRTLEPAARGMPSRSGCRRWGHRCRVGSWGVHALHSFQSVHKLLLRSATKLMIGGVQQRNASPCLACLQPRPRAAPRCARAWVAFLRPATWQASRRTCPRASWRCWPGQCT